MTTLGVIFGPQFAPERLQDTVRAAESAGVDELWLWEDCFEYSGLGHGIQDRMGQVGARAASPMTLLREYVDAVRTLLAGGTVDVEGRYVRLRDVTLGWPPAVQVPVSVGAVGPLTYARFVGEQVRPLLG